ncbi:MAG: 16S rRNA (guanine(527)-N(7))-methyltransferase RsmG [Anaeroplasma sp.]|uniref:16S rRNA (guanine(527)-N(7))-methyltransferase RsmG n=1 Tax=Anaeroplasma sp. TaxID=1872523 RepID=UPI002A91219A|nr:16S rRNA (guanine(527)-N(7))-methyltransferase RsmG [Anaeroplasma sp.]MDY5982666.1 16S rRNA (guanine(527)-N(7))-methyltransferase RsmG [Anaeroplasma sp.]
MNFKEELLKLNIELSDEASSRFDLYYKRLIAVNEVMNLTAITEEQEVYNKHFLDSLMIVKALDLNKEFTLCDVGSGAGFPSIPLSIVSNNAKVTIIDALNKRIKFLNDLILELGLKNVIALHERAEDYAKTKREFFDVTTARAVARLNILSELCLPLTKVGGYFIAMKGQGGNEEIKEAFKGIEILGGHVEKVISLELPDSAGARDIIIIKKIKETPKKYPRAFAKIKERPL